MSSFNHYARKACNPQLEIWIRWSALHSCVLRFCELTHQSFSAVRERLILPLQVGPGKPPTNHQLFNAVAILDVERNRFLERLRIFDLKRVREKAGGKSSPTNKDFEELYGPQI